MIVNKKEEQYPGQLVRHTWENGILECVAENHVVLRVEPMTDHMIRIRYGTYGYFLKDFSYAIDEKFEKNVTYANVGVHDQQITLSTAAVTVVIEKESLKCVFLDAQGNVINRDEKGFHWEYDNATGNDIVQMSKHVYPDEVYYGLGDKPMDLELRRKRLENWGSDAYGYDLGWDPLYKNIPFYYGLHNGVGYGIFFDNSFRTFFDFARERGNASSFWAHGGEMNYYFIAGPELLDVNVRFANLTGRHDMPAMWSLGFQQCKWSYYPESVVRDVCSKMREYRIPCDAIYLDIDYMDGFRCFTWDKEKFPDPKKMVAELKEDGFKTMVIIDPGIKIDQEYDVFKEGVEKDFFVKRLDGTYAEGIVWPGNCYFPDFTKPQVREWWADLYQDLIENIGIAGVWNDMNEPALFEVESKTMPDDVMFHYEGSPASHRKSHNVYGMQMARSTYEGVKKYGNNKRGLIITRSGYAGLQRYSSVWTGDNVASWQHVRLANIQCQRLAVSGVSFAGSDIGGFVGQPTPMMMTRWIQLAIFHPFCRVHSSQDDGDQEPWSFGEEVRELFREAVELRYRMLPYHYTAFYRHHKEGLPILTPLSFYDQQDTKTHHLNDEFICGDHLLVASIHDEDADSKVMYVPRGHWYNYWNEKVVKGGRNIRFEYEKNTFPLLVKEGAILPYYPLQQYVGEKDIAQVDLKVYFKIGEETSYLYDDDHNGYQYEQGAYRYSRFDLEGRGDQLTIKHTVEGQFVVPYKTFKLELIGLPDETRTLMVDGQEVQGDIIPSDFRELKMTW